MPTRYESYLKEEDKFKLFNDLVNVTMKNGFPAYVSRSQKYCMASYPLEDTKTKEVFGEAFTLLKLKNDNYNVLDFDLIINNKAKDIQLIRRLPASGEKNEHYTAEHDDARFVIETVNRYAVWDDNLEGKEAKVRLSAFAFRIKIYDSIDEYNSQFKFPEPEKTGGKNISFSEVFTMPKDEESKTPFTYFLGTVKDIKDIEAKIGKTTLDFSIITVDSFAGPLPVVASKKIFDLKDLKKGKLLEISADIKADFGADPTPSAIIKS